MAGGHTVRGDPDPPEDGEPPPLSPADTPTTLDRCVVPTLPPAAAVLAFRACRRHSAHRSEDNSPGRTVASERPSRLRACLTVSTIAATARSLGTFFPDNQSLIRCAEKLGGRFGAWAIRRSTPAAWRPNSALDNPEAEISSCRR
ncbi:hypothetical protein [Streptomyces shenzhenensis]|uniref:hypothetical protein n=1 Tax=Streptomyces shenzhenensis TaxID=943815 RepID=UPI001604FAEA|nr:hypothetical protein [Streptomyces shenzhenensis]